MWACSDKALLPTLPLLHTQTAFPQKGMLNRFAVYPFLSQYHIRKTACDWLFNFVYVFCCIAIHLDFCINTCYMNDHNHWSHCIPNCYRDYQLPNQGGKRMKTMDAYCWYTDTYPKWMYYVSFGVSYAVIRYVTFVVRHSCVSNSSVCTGLQYMHTMLYQRMTNACLRL